MWCVLTLVSTLCVACVEMCITCMSWGECRRCEAWALWGWSQGPSFQPWRRQRGSPPSLLCCLIEPCTQSLQLTPGSLNTRGGEKKYWVWFMMWKSGCITVWKSRNTIIWCNRNYPQCQFGIFRYKTALFFDSICAHFLNVHQAVSS